jgi:RHS repeat-associated protein
MNRPAQGVLGGTTATFTYDGDGKRLKKTAGANTSLYPVDEYEITNGVVTKYLSFKRLGVVAKRATSGGSTSTYWLHSDRSGSVQVVTDGSGVETFRRKFRPYGETLAQSGSHTESRGWIGERHDTETGLTFLNARYYHPTLGKFISPDPLHPTAPGVGLNRYAYGLGNPITLSDPSGLTPCTKEMIRNGDPACVGSELPEPRTPAEANSGVGSPPPSCTDDTCTTQLPPTCATGSEESAAAQGDKGEDGENETEKDDLEGNPPDEPDCEKYLRGNRPDLYNICRGFPENENNSCIRRCLQNNFWVLPFGLPGIYNPFFEIPFLFASPHPLIPFYGPGTHADCYIQCGGPRF